MNEPFIDKCLRLLDEVKSELSNDERESALEGLDEIIVLLQRAKGEKSNWSLLKEQILENLPQVVKASGQIASLIEALLNQIR